MGNEKRETEWILVSDVEALSSAGQPQQGGRPHLCGGAWGGGRVAAAGPGGGVWTGHGACVCAGPACTPSRG